MIKEKVRPKQPSHQAWSEAEKSASKTKIVDYDSKTIIEMFRIAYMAKDIDVVDIQSRKRPVVECNATLATAILSSFRGVSLKDVGILFGKHHATIIHYRDLYEESLSKVSEYRELYSELTAFAYNEKYNFGTASTTIDDGIKDKDLVVKLREEIVVLKKKLRYIRKITKIIDN